RMKSFGSDNHSGVHPKILQALVQANQEHAIAYGEDPWTQKAQAKFKEVFGAQTQSFFTFIGTAANVLSIQSLLQPYEAVICCTTAHINIDECGAPERYTASKLLTVTSPDGKFRPALAAPYMHYFDFEHHVQPKLISITQSTELGTLYSLQEIKEIADFAHQHNMYLHIDGARLANAAAALGCSLYQTSFDCGADILSFGGTKNAMMYGEAIVFRDETLAQNFKYKRKQAMQLASKMRFISAQFLALLQDEQWRKTASHANAMAHLLAQELAKIPQVQITNTPQVNAVFAKLPKACIAQLQTEYFFYIWDEMQDEVRWMCSWDTTEEEVLAFVNTLKKILAS
ncbi:MAG: low specificity L-threonine aldolase, partial [Bacteroidales bacterium]